MGTRALIHIHEKDFSTPLTATLYRRWDGGVEDLARDIRDLLNRRSFVIDDFRMVDVASFLMQRLNWAPHVNKYLHGHPNPGDEEHLYYLAMIKNTIHLCCVRGHDRYNLYGGPLDHFKACDG